MQNNSTDSQSLKDAFATFNEFSSQLTESYRQLETRVADLNDELQATHDDRIRELTEKERLASRLSLLLDVLPGGVIVLDGEGIIRENNPAAEALLGLPLLGTLWSEVISRAFAPRCDDGHEVSLADGRRVNISTCPLGAEPGQILLITDVTEMRMLQDRLTQQQRLASMGETAASLAHQIRTPLSCAMLYASNLKRPRMDDAQRRQVGEKIFSRLRHLEQLVDNMLVYARSGKSGEEFFTADVLLADLQQVLEAQLQSSHTRFNWQDETAGQRLYGNRQMILSGLINLAVNAIQAMEQGGDLKTRASIDDAGQLKLSVVDNGPGIALEAKRKLFDPFYTTRKDGTGLGLAVVQAIARAHKGEVKMYSIPGNGSTFSLHLPIFHSTQSQPEQPASESDATTNIQQMA
ncbi:Flagellar sensor histidine kinase FleS [hydrothermal vent metagenome]|uniref:Flagellar sensor histidine kinase FleS n=1 Tax=hydrothermal vent metagenome TaxID=652676 RepID=A0A3B1BFB7_9ZZZZ